MSIGQIEGCDMEGGELVKECHGCQRLCGGKGVLTRDVDG